MIRRIFTYIGTCTDPYRNLALEEYLTATVPEDACILYLWQNENTVVIGRNQNAWRECRTGLLEQEGGTLARRLSGGGAVFHDLGNLNFTFSATQENYDLSRQRQVLLEACLLLGIDAELSGRNDLLAAGRKFSGNSFYAHEGRAFHNGTLLVAADMAKMGRYLSPSQAKMESKGVDSVRSRVVNLRELCPDLTIERMAQAMTRAFEKVYGLTAQPLTEADFDTAAVDALYARFSSREWIYGRSAPMDFTCGEKFSWGELTLHLRVEGGVCQEVKVYTDAMEADLAAALERVLQGCGFSAEALCRAIASAEAAPEIRDGLAALIRKQNI